MENSVRFIAVTRYSKIGSSFLKIPFSTMYFSFIFSEYCIRKFFTDLENTEF